MKHMALLDSFAWHEKQPSQTLEQMLKMLFSIILPTIVWRLPCLESMFQSR